jgi:DNA polymerase-3 subunit delta
MAKAAPTFYLLHGEDEFNIKAHIAAMQAAMNDPSQLNTVVLNGAEVSAMAAINAVSAIPFLSDKRLVIVEGLISNLNKRGKSGKDEQAILLEELPELPDFARLVFRESGTISAKNPIFKLVKEHPRGYEKAFNVPSNPVGWITKHAKDEYSIEIEAAAARALGEVTNKDLRAVSSELDKLAAFVNYERPITEADVALLTTYVAEADIFQMVDAIGQGDGKTAMTLVQKLLRDKNDPLSLLGMINRQFRLLILAREYMDTHHSVANLASDLGLHEFVAKKMAGQARQFKDIQQLEDIYRKLAELDFKIKTGQSEATMALQLFIAGVTR